MSLTLEFDGAVVDDAKNGCMALCASLAEAAFGGDTNCTDHVDMTTYQYVSTPGQPNSLSLIHVGLLRDLPDSRVFTDAARANLTDSLRRLGFFQSGAPGRVSLVTTQEDRTALMVASVALFATTLLMLARFCCRRTTPYVAIASQSLGDEEAKLGEERPPIQR